MNAGSNVKRLSPAAAIPTCERHSLPWAPLLLDPPAIFRAVVEAIASTFGHTGVSLYGLRYWEGRR
jgi:hypothetical protein